MSDTTDVLDAPGQAGPAPEDTSGSASNGGGAAGKTKRRTAGLSGMVLSELQAVAADLGISGTARMRKGQLIEAIKDRQGDGASAASASATSAPAAAEGSADGPTEEGRDGSPQRTRRQRADRTQRPASARQGQPARDDLASDDGSGTAAEAARSATDSTEGPESGPAGAPVGRAQRHPDGNRRQQRDDGDRQQRDRGDRQQRDGGDRQQRDDGDRQQRDGADRQQAGRQQPAGQQRDNREPRDDDDFDGRGGRSRRRGRYRDRSRPRRGRDGFAPEDAEPEVSEDDVLVPVAGILDILDSDAFVRTPGYLPGPNDVYVSLAQVRKSGLRKGDAITGAVKAPREGERKEKFNALVRLDSVNGGDPEKALTRVDFGKLTPLYPQERLRLETEPGILTTRVIDLISPLGKGQRGLIVSTPKAGKTMVLQAIANAISQNNPECHLMVVLVDERPEEVTDMQRSVKGEVIASTFDRPAEDHTIVAELAIERAKRLVELGHDVVVLLDSITRLGRAYNLAAPASGRILSGGVDSTALYPPKRFLGAARNIEFGGSLTIIATAMVETGSTGDTVIFEEFKGTGNAELKLDRKIAERRVFPAVDVNPSGTRKDELLLSTDEFGVVHKLRRVLSGLDSHQAIDLLMSQLRKTKTNYEFLVQVSKTTPGNMDND